MSRTPKNITLSDHARAWAEGTNNASAYIETLLNAARARYVDARMRLDDRYNRPQMMAVLDAVNGIMWTEGLSEAVQITADLEDAEGLREKWDIAPNDWTRLMNMPEEDGRAFRVVADEFWQGRSLD